MDLAYDHILEEALKSDQNKDKPAQPAPTLNAEFQEAYKAISSSPWGAKLGGFFGSVVKQGENVYKEAQQEFHTVSGEAAKGFTDLRSSIISRTQGLTATQAQEDGGEKAAEGSTSKEGESTSKDMSTDEALKESEGVLARLKSEASKRFAEIQKAEDAADEALLKFGTNIRNFLKDAVSIAPPASDAEGQSHAVLFESRDSQGKRVIHTTRFDAQLHVIHSTLDSFTADPISEEYEPWAQNFNVEEKTDDISQDLEKYEELRSSMEKLVPDQVKYEDFFKRYYFLRHSIETAEAKRRDLLKGAVATEQDEEEVKWASDSEEDSEEESDDDQESKDDQTTKASTNDRPASAGSSATLQPATQEKEKATATATTMANLKPRKSNDEKSQADSDGSYDVVGAASGVPSRAPNSPKEKEKERAGPKKDEEGDDEDDSEEEDWE
ncbi:hypothetical protein DSL72_007092 [Monilinia vaccinii-corymbosi]|uniref:BSD domain-containing protein n=1 Tax=Monilinia vaccinii-corymbosi TaxID=61207 RepID=A0A8A3PLG4_9HELO|nr:hypothetical protein DSL72_007092 [Monilinia vaccinii-corymbosi]